MNRPFVACALGLSLLMISSCTPLPRAQAQGTQADYERAAALPKKFENTIFRSSVNPHWLPGNNAFWYRVEVGAGRHEFVFIDAVKGQRRPAFDHEALAKALARETKREVEAQKLPFSWIQPAPDSSWVRFRVGNQVWQFERDGQLHRSTQPLVEERLAPLSREQTSRGGGEPTIISFVNRSEVAAKLFWIDLDGQEKPYGEVAAGETRSQNTYVGHVWKVVGEGGKVFGTFRAKNDEAEAVFGESVAPKTKVPTEPKQAPAPQIESAAPAMTPRTEGFVRDFNVWLRDSNGHESPLTTGGTAQNFYREPVQVSPDGRFAVVSQVQPAQEHKVYMVESSPSDQLQPKLKTIGYLKPGDTIEQERPRLLDLAAKREIPTSDALFSNPWSVEDIGWSPDSQHYRFLFNQRGHQHLRVLDIDIQGQVRALVDESSTTFIDYSQKTYLHQVEGMPELIWASERDGWNHLYLYDLNTGQVKNQITTGNWVVREVVRVDDAKRQIWFRAFGLVAGQDPYYAQLARVNFDGTNLTILTEGDGNHSCKFSPDNRFLIDTYSRVDAAPITQLRDAQTGQKLCSLETSDLKPLVEAGWTVPERFEAVGRDGKTPIYGIIIRPSNFDPAKKYPVIENIYAGPHQFTVPKSFGTLTSLHTLAELGFVVVVIDGMGSNWRSRAFHDVCWKNIKDAGFPDRIAWMKAAAQTRPWMDVSRVGIYGGSAGGQNALGALLFHGDFYKVAAADCGCHDNRMDKIWWNEAWMGWPIGPEYADNSNVTHAKNLTGELLLIVGELDTNVDPASTMQAADALIKANKDFDLLVVPGGGHGAGGSAYGERRQRDFFVRHLLGVEPPRRNSQTN